MSRLASQAIKKLDTAKELLKQAKYTVVLTGAGISTPSGIPDFRSEGSGLWAQHEAMDVASLSTFRYEPSRFYDWFRPLAKDMVEAMPNPAHLALAELENAGFINTIITQNVDVLHHKAGSKKIIETHGTLRTLSCTQCFHQFESTPFLPDFVNRGSIPHCSDCGAILKPDVILFGEQLPQKKWLKAQSAARKADLMLIIGSSLEVLPVAGLPMQTLDRGGHLIIINQTPTYLDIRADLVFTEDAADLLPSLAEQVLSHAR